LKGSRASTALGRPGERAQKMPELDRSEIAGRANRGTACGHASLPSRPAIATSPGRSLLYFERVKPIAQYRVTVAGPIPRGARPFLGALLLAYHDPQGRLVCAGRVGAGIDQTELERLWRLLQPLAVSKMPLDTPPPRGARFGSLLVLSRVHWVRPQLVVKVKYLTWTGDNLLRQVVYEGLREDKPAAEVRSEQPKPGTQKLAVGCAQSKSHL